MEKLIAFDLYRKNDKGGHQPATSEDDTSFPFDRKGKAVFLADDVDALRQRLYDCESALLLRHDRALATYVGKYPHPIKNPTG